ncbi:hypothetical protein Tco_0493860 [Tanacetum coccineum]
MAEIGCNWARIGPSKSSQSLSIAHKWAVNLSKVLEEEAETDAESEGVNEAERKFPQLANDDEIARKGFKRNGKQKSKEKLAERGSY